MSTLPLFDEAPVPDDVPMAVRLQVNAPRRQTLSAAARAYNLQVQRVHKLRAQIEEMEALAQAHRQALTQHVHPLQMRYAAVQRELVLALDRALGRPSAELRLTPRQREVARDVVSDLARHLLQQGQLDMREIHDRHAARTLAEQQRAHAQQLREDLQAMLGPDADLPDADAGVDALLRAARERLAEHRAQEQAQREAARAQRAAKRQARAARAQPEPDAARPRSSARGRAQAQAEALAALQGDAEKSLRTLYRQLAGALHPDRETDPQERARKNALMSEANTAYARKDILALLELQQRAALADPLTLSRLPDERLAALTLLLKEQVAALERERAERQQALAEEFDLPLGMGLTAHALQTLRDEQCYELGCLIEAVQESLAATEDPARLKRWLSETGRQFRALERELARERAWIDDPDGG